MNNYSSLLLIVLMVVAFYFLILRPQRKRQQAQQSTLRSLEPGTRVMLTSGLFGTLVEMGEKQAVIEISPGVHLTVLKPAIARAATEADEDQPLVADGMGLGADGTTRVDRLDSVDAPHDLDHADLDDPDDPDDRPDDAARPIRRTGDVEPGSDTIRRSA